MKEKLFEFIEIIVFLVITLANLLRIFWLQRIIIV